MCTELERGAPVSLWVRFLDHISWTKVKIRHLTINNEAVCGISLPFSNICLLSTIQKSQGKILSHHPWSQFSLQPAKRMQWMSNLIMYLHDQILKCYTGSISWPIGMIDICSFDQIYLKEGKEGPIAPNVLVKHQQAIFIHENATSIYQ